jgi:hypothetical protein
VTIAFSPAPDSRLLAVPGIPQREGLGLEAERRLRRSGDLAMRDVSCEAHAGIVRLRGRLPSYYLKQMAQAIVAEIEGVRRVVNLIEIAIPPRRSPLGRERTAGAEEPIGIEQPSQAWEGPSLSEQPGRSLQRCWS